MIVLRLLRGVFLLMLAACVPAAVSTASEDVDTTLARQVQINGQRYGIAGQALMVTHNGNVLYRGAEGYANIETHERMTPEHIFPMHSVSKLLVSTLVMQLVEQGKVDLDVAASHYLPGLPASWQRITVRQFLNHMSGVPEYFDSISSKTVFPATRQEMLASLANKPLSFSPGVDIRYTQTNYVVLAALLEAEYGKAYPQIAEERIIGRLQLKHTWLGTAALPKSGVAIAYTGQNGKLTRLDDAMWPAYGFGHTELYSTLNDMTRFLEAISRGELVGKSTLKRLWQPQHLPNGQLTWVASGWDFGESSGYQEVGHDGGTHVRLRILFKDTLDGEIYTVAYLTNGSAKNVWSGTLVDSAMARVARDQFQTEALTESLFAFAFDTPPGESSTAAAINAIQENHRIAGPVLERTVNKASYAILENFGAEQAVRVFQLNTEMFPRSENVWDSLAEAYDRAGDKDNAKALREKAYRLRQYSVSGRGKRSP